MSLRAFPGDPSPLGVGACSSLLFPVTADLRPSGACGQGTGWARWAWKLRRRRTFCTVDALRRARYYLPNWYLNVQVPAVEGAHMGVRRTTLALLMAGLMLLLAGCGAGGGASEAARGAASRSPSGPTTSTRGRSRSPPPSGV